MSEPAGSFETPWVSVGELGDGFGASGSRCFAPSAGLAGKRLELHFEDASRALFEFYTATELARAVNGSGRELGATERYQATEIRAGIFLVDFVDRTAPARTVSLVIDLARGICTMLTVSLPSEASAKQPLIERIGAAGELTGVAASFLSGAIGAPFEASTERHTRTRELIGKRVEYTYSETERYEHIYLNERLYTWHCLAGSERGLADTDRCEYLKVADRLYFFVWREKIIPTLGAVLVDLQQMKTTGKIFGYRDFDFGAVVNFAVGAQARVMGGVPDREPKEIVA